MRQPLFGFQQGKTLDKGKLLGRETMTAEEENLDEENVDVCSREHAGFHTTSFMIPRKMVDVALREGYQAFSKC